MSLICGAGIKNACRRVPESSPYFNLKRDDHTNIIVLERALPNGKTSYRLINKEKKRKK
jgi:hypothetical protein